MKSLKNIFKSSSEKQINQAEMFETIQLPILIKNLNVPIAKTINENGEETGFYFKRENGCTVLHLIAIDILKEHNMEDEIYAFLFDEAKTQKIYIADDTGIVVYIRDAVDENGQRTFLWIHYHSYTEHLNKELKKVFKNFSELGECYAVAERSNYYFASIKSLVDNQKLIDATSPIVHKYLPEGFEWQFITFKEGTNIEDSLIKNDYEKLL